MYDQHNVEHLLLKKHYGGLSKEEEEELNAILKDSAAARDQATRIGDAIKSGRLEPSQHDFVDIERSWQKFQQHTIRRKKTSFPATLWLAAAMLMLVAGIGLVRYFRSDNINGPSFTIDKYPSQNIILRLNDGQVIALNKEKQTVSSGSSFIHVGMKSLDLENTTHAASGMNSLEVPPKLDYTITLADGTTVRLNSSTKFKFPFTFSETSREVFVDGEAYFTVSKDPAKPFTVHTPLGDINVLGTSFNVNTYRAGALKAGLVTGAIEIVKDVSYRLEPGQELTLSASGHAISALDSRQTLSWMNGIYFFHNTTLAEIAEIIPRWFEVKLVIDDPVLAGRRFSGTLEKHKPLSLFIDVLQQTADFSYYYSGDELHIRSRQK